MTFEKVHHEDDGTTPLVWLVVAVIVIGTLIVSSLELNWTGVK